jgi:hypothetical protein
MPTDTSLAGLLAFAQQFGASSGLVIGACIGVVGWLAQKYFAFATAKYEAYRKAIQFAEMYQKQVQSSVENYRKEFTRAEKKKTIDDVERKYRSEGRLAQMLASTSSKDMQDLILKEATSLPISVAAPILDYYSSENLFDACYNLLGSPAFASNDLITRLKCVEDCYHESEACIVAGEKCAVDLGIEATTYRNKLYALLAVNLVIFLLGLHVANKIVGIW